MNGLDPFGMQEEQRLPPRIITRGWLYDYDKLFKLPLTLPDDSEKIFTSSIDPGLPCKKGSQKIEVYRKEWALKLTVSASFVDNTGYENV